ncbi:MAG: phospholipase D-like domain-containing protein [Kiritimatiellae bacterium]|nr:phospholipase D-like domain-containing protein [Kiritimatiellia bacterium]MDD5521784.1 phospholipase D-like domain-containing protein [Kiritimatiellia bacterium]
MNDGRQYQWLTTGNEFYSAVLTAISSACESVRLETYIFSVGAPGDDIREALIAAVRRGVKVKILIDAFGSYELPPDYWAELIEAGGEYKLFNPLSLHRITIRDHRKMVICDLKVAFTGGFNITADEAGDGITNGWRDLGLKVTGSLVAEMVTSFDQMFEMADFKHSRLPRLHLFGLFSRNRREWPPAALLTSQPRRTTSPIRNALLRDLKKAHRIRIISGYFLPTWRLKNVLKRSARHANDVQIITAGKSDVPLAHYAGRALYDRFLHAGIRIYEYDAQILHTKLIITDNVVYIGSANLDTRSLNINYELLLRINDEDLAEEAIGIFESYLQHSRLIEHDAWEKARNLWEKLVERIAHFILARIDIYFARRQLSKLR